MRLCRFCVITLACLGLFGTVQAQPVSDNEMPWFNQTAANNKYALIITGAAAAPDIRDRFRRWTSTLRSTLIEDYGYDSSRIRILLDDGENVGNLSSIISGSSRVDDIKRQVSVLAEQVNEGDQLSVFLIGHGSGTFGEAKFNNVGPDMTGAELADMLSVFTAQDLIIFNTTSASFEFTRELSLPGRVVVSATRSAAERYDPLFADYLIAGLQGHTADLDRNGRVSVLEVFNYASTRVADWYREQGRLATENAVLDDTGDGLFSREPGQQQADGLLAEIAYLDVIRPVAEKTSPRAREVLSQIQSLERDIFILRNQKANYLEDDYWNRLEALLIDLAVQTREYNALP
ncbi:hypothetical protein PS2015_1034 [Pseudohongiella spirulinae]|uniref:Uncharacterized protein n=1 Tax=Pseudohongiella spirulinae TaxID=1249552 RepID=A0A0S2KC87_9GAMM|nr:hypothetical protein PS2015_1034 [Pseudohongiella spirulinae]